MIFSQDLETFVDQYFSEQMQQLNIPGAVFVLVKGEELLLAKGYGFANLEKQIPVIPERTLFRVGSISKLFTATAVMQLVEAGKLNLFADINQYLPDFKIADKYSQPIVTANLLTHTAGFDEHSIALETLNASDVPPLGEYLARRMPPRVMAPGKTINYSNHGMGLAGYLVEVVAGIPFEQYIQENIFQPLEMYCSSFQLPDHLAADLAMGYEYQADSYQSVPFSYIKIPPGGSLNATATDIANFMVAHLQNGCYKNRRIFHETTALEMHRQQFTNAPNLPGFTYGFYEHFHNNQRAIIHGGSVRGFTSQLLLLPEHELGFFLAGNSLEFQLGYEFIDKFIDRYYPGSEPAVVPEFPANFEQHAQYFTGYYRPEGYSRHTVQKISALFSQIKVSPSEGCLIIPDPLADEANQRWVEIEPLLFQLIDHQTLVAFREDNRGHITHLLRDINAFEKLPWYETRPFQLLVLGFCVLTFLISCIISLGFGIAHLSTIPELLACAIAPLNLIFIIGFVFASSYPYRLTYGVPTFLILLFCLPLLTTVMTIGLLIFTLIAVNTGDWTLWQCWYYAFMNLASIAFILWLRHWNLLGFRFS